jgi:hypothetical protein
MDDANASGVDGPVQHGRGAGLVLGKHAFGVTAPVGERGGGVDRVAASGRGRPHGGCVGHVAGDHLDAPVIWVHAERR